MLLKRFVVLLSAVMLWVAPAHAADQDFSAQQKTQIEQIIRDYLLKNPEVLVEASRSLQQKQQQQMQMQARAAILRNADALFNDKNSPTVGKSQANVTVVEFFDYQCGHCKRMADVINQLRKTNSNLRVVYKEFPIFGAESEYAAKASLAAQYQNKYQAFHDALMDVKGRLNKDLVLKTARKVGLNTRRLERDMKKPEIKQELANNVKLARDMKLIGTPAFVIASKPFNKDKQFFFVPGAASPDAMQQLIDKVATS